MWLHFVSLDNLSLSSDACERLQTLGDLGLVAKASRTSQKVMYKQPTLTCVKVLETFREIAKVYQTSSIILMVPVMFFPLASYLQLHLASHFSCWSVVIALLIDEEFGIEILLPFFS